jgi:hypothetical protein
VATNRLAASVRDPVELEEVPEPFARSLAGRPLAECSRRKYARNVRATVWLAQTPHGWQGDRLSDPLARDHAAPDYRRYHQVERGAGASTVTLAALSKQSPLEPIEPAMPASRAIWPRSH